MEERVVVKNCVAAMADFLRGSRSAQLALNIDVSLQEEI
jgi:hypothetical protein